MAQERLGPSSKKLPKPTCIIRGEPARKWAEWRMQGRSRWEFAPLSDPTLLYQSPNSFWPVINEALLEQHAQKRGLLASLHPHNFQLLPPALVLTDLDGVLPNDPEAIENYLRALNGPGIVAAAFYTQRLPLNIPEPIQKFVHGRAITRFPFLPPEDKKYLSESPKIRVFSKTHSGKGTLPHIINFFTQQANTVGKMINRYVFPFVYVGSGELDIQQLAKIDRALEETPRLTTSRRVFVHTGCLLI